MNKILNCKNSKKYDNTTGRFITPDALWDKYYAWSPYHYSANNPVNMSDGNGYMPGDLFTSEKNAAHDFGKNYNRLSISNDLEYAATLYKTTIEGKEVYSYSVPNEGTSDGSTRSLNPKGSQEVAIIHTHGSFSQASDNIFSKADLNSSKYRSLNNWVVTPNGTLLFYDFKKDNIKLISKDMPADAKDPTSNSDNILKNRNDNRQLIIVRDKEFKWVYKKDYINVEVTNQK